jgi:hypothetical protein
MPFALQRLLAPAMVLPVIVLRLLSSLFIDELFKKKLPGFPGSFRTIIILGYILLPDYALVAIIRMRTIIFSDR